MEVLDRLNDPRFLFHSLAPLLSISGINVASRAGVAWATYLPFVGEVCSAPDKGAVPSSFPRNSTHEHAEGTAKRCRHSLV